MDPDWLEFEVACSKGTYVRSLAEDLAVALGTVGHVGSAAAHRARAVRRVAGMHTLEAIEQAAGSGPSLEAMLLPVDAALPGCRRCSSGREQASVLQGSGVLAAAPGAARVRIYGVGGPLPGRRPHGVRKGARPGSGKAHDRRLAGSRSSAA